MSLFPHTRVCIPALTHVPCFDQGIPPSQLAKVDNPELKEFIKVCILFDPKRRPTAGKLLRHPFLSSVNPDLNRISESHSRASFDNVHTASIPEVPSSEWGGEIDMALDSLDEDNVFNPRGKSYGSVELELSEGEFVSRASSIGRNSDPASLEKPHKVAIHNTYPAVFSLLN